MAEMGMNKDVLKSLEMLEHCNRVKDTEHKGMFWMDISRELETGMMGMIDILGITGEKRRAATLGHENFLGEQLETTCRALIYFEVQNDSKISRS